jgi:hypothetical protein
MCKIFLSHLKDGAYSPISEVIIMDWEQVYVVKRASRRDPFQNKIVILLLEAQEGKFLIVLELPVVLSPVIKG